jgi:transposase-like protein
MASRYNDLDKARVYALLEANSGNIKRTARESGIPVATIRDWKRKQEQAGLPAGVVEALPEARSALVQQLEKTRDSALDALDRRIEQLRRDPAALAKVNPKDLATTAAILTDKARLIEGKPTSHEQSGGNLPVEQVRDLFAGVVKGMLMAAQERDAAVSSVVAGEEPIEGEATEQAEIFALPARAS